MADFTDIDPNALLPGSPWTSPIAQAVFENPIAIAEGAADAPKVVTQALGGGVILAPISQSGTTFAGYTNIGDFSEMVFSGNMRCLNPSLWLCRFSNDGGSTWGSSQTIGAGLQNALGAGLHFHINLITGDYSAVSNSANSGTLTVPADVDGIQFAGTDGSGATELFLIGRPTGYRDGTSA